MKKQTKKAVSLILAAFMTLTLLPASAFAEAGEDGPLYWGVAGEDLIISSEAGDTDSCDDKGSFSGNEEWTTEERPWDSYSGSIRNVYVKGTAAPTSTCSWFSNFTICSSLDLSGLDTSHVTNMSFMFAGWNGSAELDLSGLDTSSVTDMSGMFLACGELAAFDLSGLDTSSVTDMSNMFSYCRLEPLNLSGFNTANVTNMSNMFRSCGAETLDLSSFDTSKVTTMSGMFDECLSLRTVDLSSFDTGRVTDMSGMFRNCQRLTALDVSGFDTSNVTDMSNMFSYCSRLESLDLSNFQTASVTNMSGMFDNCRYLTALDIPNFDTSGVTDMSAMFAWCQHLPSLDVSGFDTAGVTDMRDMFSWCEGLTALDLSNFDTANVTDMSGMFDFCGNLAEVDVSGFDTASVTDMSDMFARCEKLTAINVSGFDTAAVTSTRAMFFLCGGLTALDLSGFDMSRVTDAVDMLGQMSDHLTLTVSETVADKMNQISFSMYDALYLLENGCGNAPVKYEYTYTNGADGHYTGLTAGTYYTDEEIVPSEHSYRESWESDENGHSRVCVNCGGRTDEGSHSYSNDPTVCDICGYTRTLSQTAPAPGEGYTINYGAETITVGSGYEVSTANDDSGTIASGAAVTPGTTLYIRKAADDTHAASEWAELPVPPRPDAPAAAEAVNETVSGRNDGKLVGVSETMEYKLDTAERWTDCGGAEVEGLAPGTYSVRVKAADSSFHGTEAVVVIAAGEVVGGGPSSGSDSDSGSGSGSGSSSGSDSGSGSGSGSASGSGSSSGSDSGSGSGSGSSSGSDSGSGSGSGSSSGSGSGSGSGSPEVSHGAAAEPPVEAAPAAVSNTEAELAWTRVEDVTSDDWYYESVKQIYEKGLFYGTSDSTFSPRETMSRGMLVTVLYRLAGTPEALAADQFRDVAAEKYYTQAVAWAVENNIARGYGNGSFGAEECVTREQIAVMLYNYAGNPETNGTLDTFTDGGQAGKFARTALCWAVEQGIITGKGHGTLDPKGEATRAEVAAMLVRYLAGENEAAEPAV